MKILAVLLIAIGGLMTGCVAYDDSYRYGDGYRDGYRQDGYRHGDRDRDGDGVSNRQDRRPDDPSRY